ncbi:hypothetical protein FPZ12_015815 [Amycolatopsis acidicola]|uniref:Uncharacterized protein n=1 Tax=Amycolatopsis acidicola TaxID=2596893 RepID=A0A5N0V360_9PSEU|nr:DUF6000 family protein [Amycolatopsis acidicola]KAA9160879.1 hypothetical protein FPZ12_015815 [Amycolatopsis acidicola]
MTEPEAARQDVVVRNHLEEPELGAIVSRYVTPDTRYLKLGHAGVLGMNHAERAEFGHALAVDARAITDHELTELLDYDWRARLTAGWLIALDRRTAHRGRVRELFLASEDEGAGQGYCIALARFGTSEDATILGEYLDKYLPRIDLNLEQFWALGALLYLDSELGSDEATQYLEGGWQKWLASGPTMQLIPDVEFHLMRKLCYLAEQWMNTVS